MATNRFRPDNTEGYRVADLARLNEAFAAITGAMTAETAQPDLLSWQDYAAEQLLANYDAGLRGGELVNATTKTATWWRQFDEFAQAFYAPLSDDELKFAYRVHQLGGGPLRAVYDILRHRRFGLPLIFSAPPERAQK